MNIEDLPQTLTFFQEWNGINPSRHEFLQESWLQLVNHLNEDGYEIVKRGIESRSLMEEHPTVGYVMYNFIAALFCVICAGLASGLTQGLLSLDIMEMKVKSASGTPKEKEFSSKLLPIITNHHLLLVTLLLWNASAAEALPIFLNNLVPEYVAIIISVTLVLIFGEVLPAAILTGPRQLEIAASLVPLVYVTLVIFFPVAYPMSKMLDIVIGHETGITVYNRQELATMMKLQHEEAMNTHDPTEKLIQKEEVTIIEGALKFRDLRASDAMTYFDSIVMVSAAEMLTDRLIEKITLSGFSRIPVYDKDENDIIGLIYAQDLVYANLEVEQTVGDFFKQYGHHIVVVWYDQNLSEVLKILRKENENMAIVRDIHVEIDKDPTYKLCGIITLQDIVEEIVGGKVTDLSLNDTEIQKMYETVIKEIPQLYSYTVKHRVELLELIKQSEICFLKKLTQDWEVVTNPGDLIVKKGKFINYCIVILEGNIRIEFPSNENNDFFLGAKKKKKNNHSTSSLFHWNNHNDPHNNNHNHQNDPVHSPFHNDDDDDEDDPHKYHHKKNKNKLLSSSFSNISEKLLPPLPPGFQPPSSLTMITSSIKKKPNKYRKISSDELIILGPWSILCADALVSNKNTYAPNFNAYIDSRHLRYAKLQLNPFSSITNKRKESKEKVSKRLIEMIRSRSASRIVNDEAMLMKVNASGTEDDDEDNLNTSFRVASLSIDESNKEINQNKGFVHFSF